jgi:ketosteroid isomerase-like protein
MSQENVTATREAFERYARGDFSPIGDFGDDFEYVTSPDNPDAGVYRGEAGRQWLRTWVESFADMTITGTEFIDADDKVVVGVVQRGRPVDSTVILEERWWPVLSFASGEVVRIQVFRDRDEALEAAGVES